MLLFCLNSLFDFILLDLLLVDDVDDEDYEEQDGRNQLLGFMFGNVDNSGDLDVDYLDEVIINASDSFSAWFMVNFVIAKILS